MTTTAVEQQPCVLLGQVLHLVSESLLEPLSLPTGGDIPVSDVAVYDPTDTGSAAGRLLLAVGVEPSGVAAHALLRWCSLAGAPVIVIKHAAGEDVEGLLTAAAATGIAVLGTPRDVDWAHLVTVLRAALVSAGMPPSGALSGVPHGDLFALANTIADMTGGAVTIEDAHSRVLAFSHSNAQADEPRQQSILGRQVPSQWIADLQEMGVFTALWGSEEPVRVPALPEHGMSGRLAIAVRSGGEVLGSIWLARGREPLPEQAHEALREAARATAAHLLAYVRGELSPADPSNRVLREFLDGRTTAAVLSRELGGARGPFLLAAVSARKPIEGPDANAVAIRLASLVVAFSQARRVAATVAAEVDGTATVLFAATGAEHQRARELLSDVATRTSAALHEQVVVAGGVAVDEVGQVRAQRPVVTAVLDVLRHGGSRLAAATPEDVSAQLLLGHTRHLLEEHPELRTGPVPALARLDADQGTDYIDSVAAYLAAFGDVRAAAKGIGVHPNTLRYRLRRASELTGLRLDDPDERVAAALQVRYVREMAGRR